MTDKYTTTDLVHEVALYTDVRDVLERHAENWILPEEHDGEFRRLGLVVLKALQEFEAFDGEIPFEDPKSIELWLGKRCPTLGGILPKKEPEDNKHSIVIDTEERNGTQYTEHLSKSP